MNSSRLNFSISNRNATEVDKYDVPAAATCWHLQVLAGYVVILFFTSAITNILLLWVLLRRKEMRTPVNSFIIFFTILSLFGTCSEFPLITISMLKCKYVKKNRISVKSKSLFKNKMQIFL